MNPFAVAALMDEHPRLWDGDTRPGDAQQVFIRLATEARLLRASCYCGNLAGGAIIAGIVFTYDLSRQTVLDDARAQAQLHSKQLPDDL
jgi:hypothetical protein